MRRRPEVANSPSYVIVLLVRSSPMPHRPHAVDPIALLQLFYAQPAEALQLEQVSASDVPEPFHQLLVHDNHMTVTVEAFHDSLVDVQVLQVVRDDNRYARKILLTRQSDRGPIQFGVVRLVRSMFTPVVWREILSEATPLGRILEEHQLLRTVKLRSLYRVILGEEVAGLLQWPGNAPIYGRTALIHVNDEPAIELLEIVTPG